MSENNDPLQRIGAEEQLSTLFAEVFEFNVHRTAPTDSPRLASGMTLEPIGGDFTGGMFYLCGDGESSRPVLYASSEGGAGIIAGNLIEALELIIGFPYWRDCLGYSSNGDLASMELAAEFLTLDLLADHPSVAAEQARAATSLGLAVVPLDVLVPRLHASVRDAGETFTFHDDTGMYGGLFGPFSPSRNSRWN